MTEEEPARFNSLAFLSPLTMLKSLALVNAPHAMRKPLPLLHCCPALERLEVDQLMAYQQGPAVVAAGVAGLATALDAAETAQAALQAAGEVVAAAAAAAAAAVCDAALAAALQAGPAAAPAALAALTSIRVLDDLAMQGLAVEDDEQGERPPPAGGAAPGA